MGTTARSKRVMNRNCRGPCPAVCNLIIRDESTRYSVHFPPLAAFNEGTAEILRGSISVIQRGGNIAVLSLASKSRVVPTVPSPSALRVLLKDKKHELRSFKVRCVSPWMRHFVQREMRSFKVTLVSPCPMQHERKRFGRMVVPKQFLATIDYHSRKNDNGSQRRSYSNDTRLRHYATVEALFRYQHTAVLKTVAEQEPVQEHGCLFCIQLICISLRLLGPLDGGVEEEEEECIADGNELVTKDEYSMDENFAADFEMDNLTCEDMEYFCVKGEENGSREMGDTEMEVESEKGRPPPLEPEEWDGPRNNPLGIQDMTQRSPQHHRLSGGSSADGH
ncbi:hypothetical protein IRJ41_011411 [Triplophysa rosa]|uniref:Uncharacterized protein n=1 Tax=Triplophysa rosa TaxID=992332 RepID=A0A9W7WQP7_TRIRA|nr:hypothetical protein IRJ41_011411 [Triplophysa rosa]